MGEKLESKELSSVEIDELKALATGDQERYRSVDLSDGKTFIMDFNPADDGTLKGTYIDNDGTATEISYTQEGLEYFAGTHNEAVFWADYKGKSEQVSPVVREMAATFTKGLEVVKEANEAKMEAEAPKVEAPEEMGFFDKMKAKVADAVADVSDGIKEKAADIKDDITDSVRDSLKGDAPDYVEATCADGSMMTVELAANANGNFNCMITQENGDVEFKEYSLAELEDKAAADPALQEAALAAAEASQKDPSNSRIAAVTNELPDELPEQQGIMSLLGDRVEDVAVAAADGVKDVVVEAAGAAADKVQEVYVAYTAPDEQAGTPVANTGGDPLEPGTKSIVLQGADGSQADLTEGYNKTVDAPGSQRMETPVAELPAANAAMAQSIEAAELAAQTNNLAADGYEAPQMAAS